MMKAITSAYFHVWKGEICAIDHPNYDWEAQTVTMEITTLHV